MTIELTRRLLRGGAPREPVGAALLAEIETGAPFVQALLDRAPGLGDLVQRELERAEVAEIHVVRASSELCQRLPPGMCERLMAVPVFRDPQGGRVDVAAVNALDPHVRDEFAYQLEAPVRVLRAAAPQIRSALGGLAGAPRQQSDPPIPLVRRPAAAAAPAHAGEEPVLTLTRSKIASPRPAFTFASAVEDGLLALERAGTPDEIARALCHAFEPACALVLLCRPQGFEARAASAALGPERPSLELPAGKNSICDIAVRNGFYLGPLPGTLIHAELRALFPSAALEEVYAAPVLVAGRPVLIAILARFGVALEATRRAERLILATSQAIERVLRSKKMR